LTTENYNGEKKGALPLEKGGKGKRGRGGIRPAAAPFYFPRKFGGGACEREKKGKGKSITKRRERKGGGEENANRAPPDLPFPTLNSGPHSCGLEAGRHRDRRAEGKKKKVIWAKVGRGRRRKEEEKVRSSMTGIFVSL